ncbi:MAG: amino acid transporter [Alphaproteobacteria bacterium 16-39-46]|nr:MAG: amino acid transporter [Alphaproteobacteria bacterium 16-39-46]OZA42719.1 MAG: amino acid transporter [Alphaproteobacteria bacterium 17-39-52]HQS83620.1 LysE/ArgO family amino acid transporter [Alphaproteobacteria bacterium]HQS93361.1 LysE/ArgO family amino acid transporter [Alphaproteobacteria bacterium]
MTTSPCWLPLLEGFGTGAGLIIAIGAQNAFVLKQGLLKNHVFATALFCALIDALLIAVGVLGFGQVVSQSPLLLNIATWGGAAFLIYYGGRSFYAVFSTQSLDVHTSTKHPSLKATLLTLSALSFLNPHLYLDTVVLLGSISAQFQENSRLFFALGAILASFLWFFSLSYGARFLAPLFRKPMAWKILDFLIGCTMFGIALSLIY